MTKYIVLLILLACSSIDFEQDLIELDHCQAIGMANGHIDMEVCGD